MSYRIIKHRQITYALLGQAALPGGNQSLTKVYLATKILLIIIKMIKSMKFYSLKLLVIRSLKQTKRASFAR